VRRGQLGMRMNLSIATLRPAVRCLTSGSKLTVIASKLMINPCMSAGAKIGHSTPCERGVAAE
jgi:hypothetical protein